MIFILGHAYQGAAGMLRIVPVSVGLTLIFLLSGSLWPGIILHALADLAGGAVFQILNRIVSSPGPPPSPRAASLTDSLPRESRLSITQHHHVALVLLHLLRRGLVLADAVAGRPVLRQEPGACARKVSRRRVMGRRWEQHGELLWEEVEIDAVACARAFIIGSYVVRSFVCRSFAGITALTRHRVLSPRRHRGLHLAISSIAIRFKCSRLPLNRC